MKAGLLVLALTAACLSNPALALCDRDFADPIQLMVSLMHEAKGRPSFENGQFISFGNLGDGSAFTFTKKGHPAHPAVVCRSPVKIGDVFHIKTEASCAAPKEACEKLMRDFQAMTDNVH